MEGKSGAPKLQYCWGILRKKNAVSPVFSRYRPSGSLFGTLGADYWG